LATRFNNAGQALDAMGIPSSEIACPHCRRKLPPSFLGMPHHIISLVGDQSAGKSYYLSVLTKVLPTTLYREFSVVFQDGDPTGNAPVNDMRKALFGAQSPAEAKLAKTQFEGAMYERLPRQGRMVALPRPFVYTLAAEEKTRDQCALIFYDNAGEHFQPGVNIVEQPGAQHVASAAGIMYLFDPFNSPEHATPPVILRDWTGWAKSWTKEPQMLQDENWSELSALASGTNIPAQTWQRLTGDAVNGYGFLEARAGASFRVDDTTDEDVLKLFAESLELLEVRDARRDFRASSWIYTFTTSMQEQDNPADFRWRCFHSDNPAANRFVTPDCRALSAVRAIKWTDEETAFARTGRQPPRFIVEPTDVRIIEGEAVRFTAQAEGVPGPTYQWYSVDRADNGQVLPGETKPELVVSNPVLGKSRYIVSATNSAGTAQSSVATLSVEQKVKLAARTDAGSRGSAKPALYSEDYQEKKERQLRRLETEKAQKMFQKRVRWNKIIVTLLTMVLIAGVGMFAWEKKKSGGKKDHIPPKAAPATVAAGQTNSPTNAKQAEKANGNPTGEPLQMERPPLPPG